MGTTLKELLESNDLGASGQTKTASAKATAADVDGMDKLAMQLGLFSDVSTGTEKVAEFPPKKDDDKKDEKKEEKKEEDEGEKKASGSLHALLFPDSVLGGAEKTAAEKQAAAEQLLGGLAFDQFSKSFDGFVEKLASEVISGNPHGDSQPHNRLPNNKPGDAASAINTTPSVTDNVKAKNDAGTVGHFEQKTAAAQAFRKQMLLAQLEA